MFFRSFFNPTSSFFMFFRHFAGEFSVSKCSDLHTCGITLNVRILTSFNKKAPGAVQSLKNTIDLEKKNIKRCLDFQCEFIQRSMKNIWRTHWLKFGCLQKAGLSSASYPAGCYKKHAPMEGAQNQRIKSQV